MTGKLANKVAIVTGSASGIGRAIANQFAQAGARIVLADINAEGNAETADQARAKNGVVSTIQTDVSQASAINEMINHALDTYERVDILVNNAGIGSPPLPIHATDEGDWNRVLDVSLKSVFLGMKYVLPQMMEQGGGNIINIASIAGVIASPGLAPYAAAKAGVIELTKVAAAEYSRYNIRCNAIAPGWTDTPMVADYAANDDETLARMKKGIPMRRFGHIDEIAAATLFLASDEAAFIQGHTLVIDGGITIV